MLATKRNDTLTSPFDASLTDRNIEGTRARRPDIVDVQLWAICLVRTLSSNSPGIVDAGKVLYFRTKDGEHDLGGLRMNDTAAVKEVCLQATMTTRQTSAPSFSHCIRQTSAWANSEIAHQVDA